MKNQAKRQDYPFEEMSEKDVEMENMMRKMNNAGLGGGMNMYNREDIMAQMAAGGGEDGEYGDMMGGMGGGYGGGEEKDDSGDGDAGYEF